MIKRSIFALFVVLVAGVFLVACGSGDAESGSDGGGASGSSESGADNGGAADEQGGGEEPAAGDDSAAAGGDEADSEGADFAELTASDMVFRYRVVGDSMEVEVEAPTTGWVAVGFDPERGMQGANFVIGYVAGGEATVEDHYGNGMTSHSSDESLGGRRDVTEVTGTESDGSTTIGFRLPLDSGDEYDKPLESGGEYTVLLAYGPNNADDVTSYHQFRTQATFSVP